MKESMRESCMHGSVSLRKRRNESWDKGGRDSKCTK